MSLTHMLLLAGAVLLLFWIGPCLLSMALIFCRRQSEDAAMNKPYFAPFRGEMEACAAFLEQQPHTRVRVCAPDGTELSAVWYDRRSPKTVIMAHGFRASAMSNFCISGRAFFEKGYNLLLIDQRNSGRSGGRYTTFGLKEQYDLLRWIEWTETDTETKILTVYGVSMGCAAMAYASDKIGPDRVKAMVLDCGYLSPRAQIVYTGIERRVPWQIMLPVIRLCVRLFMGADINTPVAASLKATKIPAFFLHGAEDRTVPAEDGRQNYEACASEKELVVVPGAGHTMAFVMGGEAVRARLFAFLERYANNEGKKG